MRKLITILILGCLIIYMGGYHLVYAIFQCGMKQEMKSYLSTHKDPRLGTYLHVKIDHGKITNTDFEWEELNEEFSYQHEMYDVVTIQYTTDSLHICAIKDTRENLLAQNIQEIYQKKQSNSSSSSLSVLKFFSIFIFDLPDGVFLVPKNRMLYATATIPVFFSTFFDVTAPPPRC